jgi:hypothetical protein
VLRRTPETFGELSPLEAGLVACAAEGRELDCAPDSRPTAKIEDVTDWDRRQIRAEIVAALCTKEVFDFDVHPRRGLRLRGACIVGHLNLSDAVLARQPLGFVACRFDEGVTIARCSAGLVSFISCTIAGLDANELDLSASLVLTESRLTRLHLRDADIRGVVECRRATFTNPGDIALNADRVRAAAFRLDDVEVVGTVRLLHAEMRGDFVCRRAKLSCPGGMALQASIGAAGAFLTGVRAEGEMRFVGARIGGLLTCERAKLSNPDGVAFGGEGLRVGELSFEQAEAIGEVRLLGTHVEGQLTCRGATLRNPGRAALQGDRLRAGEVILHDVTTDGEVLLAGAEISGRLSCDGATLVNPGGMVLSGYGMQVGADVSLRNLDATGRIVLLWANIGGRLSCYGSRLSNPGGVALAADGCRVSGSLVLLLREQAVGEISLEHAEVGPLVDDLSSWPAPPTAIRLVGFSYRSIESSDRAPAQRIDWLRRSHPFSPEPYRQLEAVYRRFGQRAHAREVGIASEDDLLRRGDLSRPTKIWHRFLRATVGYGYRPWKALVPLAVLLVAASVLWSTPAARRAMEPTQEEQAASAVRCTSSYPCFVPVVYALDVLLPVVDLHQEEAWRPAPSRPYGWAYAGFTWVLIIAGWGLTSAVVAGAASLIRRD